MGSGGSGGDPSNSAEGAQSTAGSGTGGSGAGGSGEDTQQGGAATADSMAAADLLTRPRTELPQPGIDGEYPAK